MKRCLQSLRVRAGQIGAALSSGRALAAELLLAGIVLMDWAISMVSLPLAVFVLGLAATAIGLLGLRGFTASKVRRVP